MEENIFKDKPMAGDVVRISYSYDPMFRRNEFGVILGEIGKPLKKVVISFNNDLPILIENGEVKPTGNYKLYKVTNSKLKRRKENGIKKMLFVKAELKDKKNCAKHIFQDVKYFKFSI